MTPPSKNIRTMEFKIPMWKIQEMTGYEPKTTFWQDFSIADKFGLSSIKDTYKRVFLEWADNVEYVTELAMVLNWKCWEHWHRSRKEMETFCDNHAEIGQWYKDKYYELLDWADKNLKGDDLTYFYKTLD